MRTFLPPVKCGLRPLRSPAGPVLAPLRPARRRRTRPEDREGELLRPHRQCAGRTGGDGDRSCSAGRELGARQRVPVPAQEPSRGLDTGLIVSASVARPRWSRREPCTDRWDRLQRSCGRERWGTPRRGASRQVPGDASSPLGARRGQPQPAVNVLVKLGIAGFGSMPRSMSKSTTRTSESFVIRSAQSPGIASSDAVTV